jgi:hypothetical protein
MPITISNGSEFYRIAKTDLAAAKNDGFYVPTERGMTIVTDGKDIFEIALADVADATADGFRDVLADERAGRKPKRRKNQPAPTMALAIPGMAAVEVVDVSSFALETDTPEAVESVHIEGGDDLEIVAEPVAIESGQEEVETVADDEVEVDTQDLEEARELERQRVEELEESTGWDWFVLYVKYRVVPDEEKRREFMTAYGTSAMVLAIVMLCLALWILPKKDDPNNAMISSTMTDAMVPTEEEEQPVEVETPEVSPDPEPTEIASEDISDVNTDVDISDLKPANLPIEALAAGPSVNVPLAGPLAGRSKSGRKSSVTKYGGTAGSESAVGAALAWVAKHQMADGGWSFDHSAVQGCSCGNPGGHEHRTGATGFALLTLMGAGQSFVDGEYKGNVQAGIMFLLNSLNLKPSGYSADLLGGAGHGGIYAHGIATSAICEALAMNNAYIAAMRNDKELELTSADGKRVTMSHLLKNQRTLRDGAQLALNYTVQHQSPTTGGFGYTPKSKGDTSILGWQVMGLTSGKMAHLEIPQNCWAGCANFLDTVQDGGGAYYGYSSKSRKNSTTAIGLLCRMYQGWAKSHPPFVQGVKYLSRTGPAANDMYYNYYATQVVFHWGDDGKEDLWTKWNTVMRDRLVKTQRRDGHQAGSWDMADAHGAKGGRLYMTCLAAMTLEIYYRKLPIYKKLEGGTKKPDPTAVSQRIR